MVKHTETISRQQLANCLSVFDHFLLLTLKQLTYINYLEIACRLQALQLISNKSKQID